MAPLSFDPNLWADRVQVARDAAAELEQLGVALSNTLSKNYFGLDCLEGEALYIRLKDLVGACSGDLQELAVAAGAIARSSVLAEADIPTADRAGATEMANGG